MSEAGVAEPGSLELHGRALLDYFEGDLEATLVLHSSLGEHDEIPLGLFFREPADFFPFEAAALPLARGRILDAGAGTGVHALPLQRAGFDVTAIEIVPEAVRIMRARGVRRAVEGDMLEADLGPFDTVLMLMNGVGPVGTLDGLDRFLGRADRLLAAGGQILVDSGEPLLPESPGGGAPDAAGDTAPGAVARPEWPSGGGTGYPGEAWIRLEYGGLVGAPFRELYVDADTFARRAGAAGWRFDLAYQDGTGGYLARLTRKEP